MNKVQYVIAPSLAFMYQKSVKPVLFRYDPENVHDRITALSRMTGENPITRGVVKTVMAYSSPLLEQDIKGVHFSNPIGLSAGFDKNALLTDFMPALGFGFMEIGSITGEPCEGNNKPRLQRLPKSKSILVYYGLRNDGANAISARLKNKNFRLPIGTNIAKTNSRAACDDGVGIADYVKAFKAFAEIGSYFTVNISCPNTYGGQPFHDALRLDALFTALDPIPTKKPVFVKLSPDLSDDQIDDIIEVAGRHRIDGFICSNLTKNRDNANIKDINLNEAGGLSGKIVEELSNQLIAKMYQKTDGKYVIIGVGGVFTAEDAYRKIRLGASLVELITGMIYQGPQAIGQINRGLVKLLKRDGFENISEAVGVDNPIRSRV